MDKKRLIEIARDLFHGYLGFAVMYFSFTLSLAIFFTQDSKAFGVLFMSGIGGLAVNVLFNFLQGLLFGIDSKRDEYYIGIIGGLVGGWISLYYPNQTIAIAQFIVVVLVCVYDLKRTKKQ
jgi:hypothetical protein